MAFEWVERIIVGMPKQTFADVDGDVNVVVWKYGENRQIAAR